MNLVQKNVQKNKHKLYTSFTLVVVLSRIIDLKGILMTGLTGEVGGGGREVWVDGVTSYFSPLVLFTSSSQHFMWEKLNSTFS